MLTFFLGHEPNPLGGLVWWLLRLTLQGKCPGPLLERLQLLPGESRAFHRANLQPSPVVKGSHEVQKLQLKIEMALWNLIPVASKGAGPGTQTSLSSKSIFIFFFFLLFFNFSPWISCSTSVLNFHRKAGG